MTFFSVFISFANLIFYFSNWRDQFAIVSIHLFVLFIISFFFIEYSALIFFSYFVNTTKKRMKKMKLIDENLLSSCFFFHRIDSQWVQIMIDIFEKIILHYNAQKILFTKLIFLYTKKTKIWKWWINECSFFHCCCCCFDWKLK